MKKCPMLLSITLMAFLSTSCSIIFGPTNSSDNSSDSSGDAPFSGSIDSGSADTTVPSSYSGSGTVTLYSINDFHGAIVENQSSGEMGLLNVGTYFKNKGEEDNTLLISSGDMFQGSIESNWNRGKFLTDAMDLIGFDAFTLGNHEFDWGLETLRSLRNRKQYDYKTPWLSSNIYTWDDTTKAASDTRVSDLGYSYSTKVLENGLRVGFVGAIGSSQWTSITSGYVSDITFIDPVPVIKSISDTLRTKENCDLVILVYHGSQDELLNQGLTDVSSVSNKKYVDSVFCAHTHTQETATENGVVFTQNNSNGRNASKITLTIGADKTVTKSSRVVLNWSSIVNEVNGKYDSDLQTLYNTYTAETDSVGSEVLATLSGEFSSSFANVAADALLEEAISQGYNPILSITNKVRSYPEAGEYTYADLLKAMPFENAAVIMKAKGSEIKNEAKYNFVSINPSFTSTINNNTVYTIVCIDYLAYHMNTEHEYNYFPSFQYVADLKDSNNEIYGYRDITAAYLKNKGTLAADDYSSSLDKFNNKSL